MKTFALCAFWYFAGMLTLALGAWTGRQLRIRQSEDTFAIRQDGEA